MRRKIVRIDEEKCDGCGLCASACAEGAIRITDGKARLVSETYCDGLGACIGECPRGAITVEEREAEPFDPKAVEAHLERIGRKLSGAVRSSGHGGTHGSADHEAARGGAVAEAYGSSDTGARQKKTGDAPCACPGSMSRFFGAGAGAPSQPRPAGSGSGMTGPDPVKADGDGTPRPSALRNWPLQLHLAPISAPQYDGATLLISADCVPFALADFHSRLLDGRTLIIGCPKLDDTDAYLEKLTGIFRRNGIRAVEVAHMEVPCCFALVHLVRTALRDSGKDIPLTLVRVGIRGGVQEVSRG
ncbi:MAG: 4Fe-4S binding protein [Planctomycetota bacterium]|nr:4Fe-4S binding protein [Planctomycetota bacterium]